MSKIIDFDKFLMAGKIDSFALCISGKQGANDIGLIVYSEENLMCSRIYYTKSVPVILSQVTLSYYSLTDALSP